MYWNIFDLIKLEQSTSDIPSGTTIRSLGYERLWVPWGQKRNSSFPCNPSVSILNHNWMYIVENEEKRFLSAIRCSVMHEVKRNIEDIQYIPMLRSLYCSSSLPTVQYPYRRGYCNSAEDNPFGVFKVRN